MSAGPMSAGLVTGPPPNRLMSHFSMHLCTYDRWLPALSRQRARTAPFGPCTTTVAVFKIISLCVAKCAAAPFFGAPSLDSVVEPDIELAKVVPLRVGLGSTKAGALRRSRLPVPRANKSSLHQGGRRSNALKD